MLARHPAPAALCAPARRAHGFTLIELLAVIVIIAVLASVAIPVFLHQRSRAYQSAAQQTLSTLAKAQESYFVENSAYTADTTTVSGLREQGWQPDEGVSVVVALSNPTYPGGYCLEAFATGAAEKVYRYTNIGPGSGEIVEGSATAGTLAACI